MMKPSAPVSPALASIHYVHTSLFEYQAPNSQQHHIANTFFFLFQLLAGQIQLAAPRVSEYK